MNKQLNAIILAAGQGTRLKIDRPKPLAPLAGRCLLDYVIDAVTGLKNEVGIEISTGIVVGHKKELIEKHLEIAFSNDKFHIT